LGAGQEIVLGTEKGAKIPGTAFYQKFLAKISKDFAFNYDSRALNLINALLVGEPEPDISV